MSNSGWVVPNFYKAPQDSLFDKEYDYFVSLGHRCCVGQALTTCVNLLFRLIGK